MYSKDQIKLQNQQDSWSLMYLHLAKSIMTVCGRNGESIIRSAIKEMGRIQGETLRKQHIEKNMLTNIKTLYKYGCGAIYDPRMVENLIEETEQVRLWEIWVCPMGDYWNKAAQSKLGSYYCEEYQHALLDSYTKGKGQMNISKTLTCMRDNHCRFSAYYRPANTDGKLREESFGFEEENNHEYSMVPMPFEDYIKKKSILLYSCLFSTARKIKGNEGVCAITIGLRNFSIETISTMKKHADDVAEKYDEAFYEKNFIFSLSDTHCEDSEASEILRSILLNKLKDSIVI